MIFVRTLCYLRALCYLLGIRAGAGDSLIEPRSVLNNPLSLTIDQNSSRRSKLVSQTKLHHAARAFAGRIVDLTEGG